MKKLLTFFAATSLFVSTVATAIVLMLAYSCECPAQSPTPYSNDYASPQLELEAWWNWCMAHSKVIYRESKRFGNERATRPYTQRLNVPGPPSLTPFGSMNRYSTYITSINAGGHPYHANQGWTYQTETSPDIGNGPPERIEWGTE